MQLVHLLNLLFTHLFLLLRSQTFLLTLHEVLYESENTREGDIHTFNNIRQLDIVGALLGHLLDIVTGRRVIG